MAYQIRWDTPSTSNKYYSTSGKNYFQGQYNGFSGNGHGNCTWYAYGRFCEIQGNWNKPPINPKPGHSDAGNWPNLINPACAHGTKPEVGAVAIWTDPVNGRPGHVAIVERINSNGTLLVSESGWDAYLFRTSTTYDRGGVYGQCVNWMKAGSRYSGYRLWGFIYNPAIHGSSAGNSETGTGGQPSDPAPTDKEHINWAYGPKHTQGLYSGLTDDEVRNNGIYTYLFLRDKGWKIKPICAVLGYLQWHSRFSCVYLIGTSELHVSGGLMPNDEDQGYGLFTWSPSRDLINFLQSNNYTIGMVDDGSGFLRGYDFEHENDAYGQLEYFTDHTMEPIDWNNTSQYYEAFSVFGTDVYSQTQHTTEWLTRCFIDSWVGLDTFINENSKLIIIDYAKNWESYIRGNEIADKYSIVPGDGSKDDDDDSPQVVYPDYSDDDGPGDQPSPVGSYRKPNNKHLLVARRRSASLF